MFSKFKPALATLLLMGAVLAAPAAAYAAEGDLAASASIAAQDESDTNGNPYPSTTGL